MSDIGALIVWAFVLVLLVLTIANQFTGIRWIARVKQYDVGALIPYWTFFAPTPGTTDTRVFWRELRTDGITSGWREIRPPTNAGIVSALWNPGKRQRKLIIDAGQMVARTAATDPQNPLTLVSLPYLLLLRCVSDAEVSGLTAARQFMVVDTTETGMRRPLMLSGWHAVDRQPPATYALRHTTPHR